MASFETKRRCRRLVNDSIFAGRNEERPSFDHLVGNGKHRGRNVEAECFALEPEIK
jgi:hypothetical protein